MKQRELDYKNSLNKFNKKIKKIHKIFKIKFNNCNKMLEERLKN